MWRFAYYGISCEECKGTSRSSPLGEASITVSRLTLVGFFTLVEWLTWWIRPMRWSTSTAEGLGVSELISIPCTDTGSSVMPLGEAWGPDPGGRYWGPSFSESSCQASIGMGMLEE